jgi:hypothetical protein
MFSDHSPMEIADGLPLSAGNKDLLPLIRTIAATETTLEDTSILSVQ